MIRSRFPDPLMTKRKPSSTESKIDASTQMGSGRRPVVSDSKAGVPDERASDSDVAEFIAKMKTIGSVAAVGRGRLIFGMDATMSRAPTWDMALQLQGDMFHAVKQVGGLDVQLVYFRGMGECRASKWVSDPDALASLMASVACHGGLTQIGKVLKHAIDESGARKINALVYVGDCMEEDIDHLCARAGELALLGVPVFLFQEGKMRTPNALSARLPGLRTAPSAVSILVLRGSCVIFSRLLQSMLLVGTRRCSL